MNIELYNKNLDILEKRDINILDLRIIDEIECCLDREMSIGDRSRIFNVVKRMYLKYEGNMGLNNMVRFCLSKDLKELEDKGTWDLLEECVWFD